MKAIGWTLFYLFCLMFGFLFWPLWLVLLIVAAIQISRIGMKST